MNLTTVSDSKKKSIQSVQFIYKFEQSKIGQIKNLVYERSLIL